VRARYLQYCNTHATFLIYTYKYLLVYFAAFYFFVFALVYNTYAFFKFSFRIVFFLPQLLFDLSLCAILKFLNFYYKSVINYFRRFHNHFVGILGFYFLTFFFSVLFLFEILYVFSPFIAKGIIYFYNPFSLLFTVYSYFYIVAFCMF
jgi:hypothetical protein